MNDKLKNPLFNSIGLVGIGLMGGSFAAAIRENGLASLIMGTDLNPENIEYALSEGLIDQKIDFDMLGSCELIVLAAPVKANLKAVEDLSEILDAHCMTRAILDLGSTKKSIMGKSFNLPDEVSFIGGHPMSGSEKSGPEAADKLMYKDSIFFLTPSMQCREEVLKRVIELIEKMGAAPVFLEAEAHDSLMSVLSHLPHIISSVLLMSVEKRCRNESGWQKLAGKGLRDTTRISAGEPSLWRDICIDNSPEILEVIKEFKKEFEEFEALLRTGDDEGLYEYFSHVQNARIELEKNKNFRGV